MNIQQTINNLPKQPGVYQFYDSNGTILYVGKAKNLKSRVSSYFNKGKVDSFKTRKLASQVHEIKHIVVETEADALLLENNLIKQFQPKYNILLKDDKTFPWICIKNEPFPRIFATRNRIKDGSEYFGPYTSALMVKTLLNLIRQLYQIRTCKYLLNEVNIKAGKFKSCLEYDIGNCLAPCEGYQLEEDYSKSVEVIREILRGKLSDVQDYLYKTMLDFSSKLLFEEAEKVKLRYELLQKFRSKSTIVNPKLKNLDVFSFVEEKSNAFVNYLKIIDGAIIQSHTVELTKRLDETREELLLFALFDIRQKVFSDSKEVLVPFSLDEIEGIKFTVPQIGDKKKLMELSERNARQYAYQKNLRKVEASEKFNKNNLLQVIKTDLRLKELPVHMECFDNSNIQGTNPVASCVVFKNGKPAKSEYRHFHVKTVQGPDDFASMEEIVYRRYKRLLDEKEGLPQLIVIDGGKGQLGAAVKSLHELNLYGKIAVLGIAKRLEELYFPGDSVPLYLDKNSKTLRVIQHMRNEAHRFGITFHRNIRSKAMLKNQLTGIDGIGEKTYEKLIKKFGSIEQVSLKSLEELQEIVPERVAKNILNFFHKME
jgi:excinuclease ABC subunit C